MESVQKSKTVQNEFQKIQINQEKCIGCGLCDEVCPFGLPKRDSGGKFVITRSFLCTECSACQRNCPTQAIIMMEQKGCGCLWNVKARKKGEKNCC